MAADAAPAQVWAPGIPEVGRSLDLEEDEARYVSRVCRARPGERLRVTDGRGVVAELVLSATGRRVSGEVVARSREERAHGLTLACGAPEGERGDWLVEKLAELGVARWQPVDCERAAWREGASRVDRWTRLARAALRQSLQSWQMEIGAPAPVETFLRDLGPGGRRWLADRDGARGQGGPAPETILVGPAEGLSGDEKGLVAAAGFEPISLGTSRLRTETAALAAAVLGRLR